MFPYKEDMFYNVSVMDSIVSPPLNSDVEALNVGNSEFYCIWQ